MKKTKMVCSIAFVIFILSQVNLKASYEPTAIHELIIKSDRIVYGEIIDLDSTHFELKIAASLTDDSGILKIRKFKNWTCAWRWTEYKKGQNLLLFLHYWDDELVSMGAGNEGELPIVDNQIYINGLSLMYVNGNQNDWSNSDFTFKSEHFDLHGDDFYGVKMDLVKFIETTKYIRKCMNFGYDNYYQPSNWYFKCEQEEINEEAKSSILLNAILREVRERISER